MTRISSRAADMRLNELARQALSQQAGDRE